MGKKDIDIEQEVLEVDDPNQPDEDEMPAKRSRKPPAEEADDFEDDVLVEEEPEEEAGEEPKAKPQVKPEAKPEPKAAAGLSQVDIDRIVQDRLARDRAVRDRELVAATGKTLQQLTAEARRTDIERLQTERGIDEETATEIVDERAKRRQAEETASAAAQEKVIYERLRRYQAEKNRLADDPFLKIHADEVDAITEHGTAEIELPAALLFVKGRSYDEDVKAAFEAGQKAAAAKIKERSGVAPEKGGTPTPGGATRLSPAQRNMARNLGLTDAEYVAGLRKR